MYGQDDGHRACQTGQFPQFQVQKSHGKEERQGSVTEYVDGAVEHIDFEGCSQDVADDHTCKQTPYEFRQVEEGFVVAVDDFGKSQTCGKHSQGFDSGVSRNQACTLCFFEDVVGNIVVVGFGSFDDRFTTHFVDQTACNRTADQTAEYQAECCRSHTQTGCAGQTEFAFKVRTPCAGCTVTTGQGNRTGNQANQWIQAQCARQADTDEVLDDDECTHHGGKDNQRQTARFQTGEVGAQTDGCKEDKHERILQRFFKFEADAVGFMQGEQDDSGNQTAGDRLGNIEVS